MIESITSADLAEGGGKRGEEKSQERLFLLHFVSFTSYRLAMRRIKMRTGATDRRAALLDICVCVHEEVVEEKGTKNGSPHSKRKGVKNCTPNKIIQKKKTGEKNMFNQSDRQAIFILDLH